MSIGRICDSDSTARFTKESGVVRSKGGKAIFTFEPDKGLYEAQLKAKRGDSPINLELTIPVLPGNVSPDRQRCLSSGVLTCH